MINPPIYRNIINFLQEIVKYYGIITLTKSNLVNYRMLLCLGCDIIIDSSKNYVKKYIFGVIK